MIFDSKQKILTILEIAKETTEELGNLPSCDLNKLNELSNRYLTLVTEIKSNLQKNSAFIRPYHPYSQGNYDLKREVEVAEAAKRLAKNCSS